jgi:hypothetical protein
LVVLAYALFLWNAPLVAGLLFGLAVLVTPLSGPMVVPFLLTIPMQRGARRASVVAQVRKVAKFGLAASLVYLPPVFCHYEAYVYGGRGLTAAPRAHYPWLERLSRSIGYIAGDGGLALLLCALGAAACLWSPRIWRLGQPVIALVVSVIVIALAGERFPDVPVQLPNLLLLMALPPVAFAILPWGARLGVPLLVALCSFELHHNYDRVLAEVESQDRDRRFFASVREQSLPHQPMLVGVAGWGPKRMFERYAATGAQLAPVFDTREFFVRSTRVATGKNYQIWFLRRASSPKLAPLLGRYLLESRTVDGHLYQVLVPRPN